MLRPTAESIQRLGVPDAQVNNHRRPQFDPAIGLVAFRALPPLSYCSLTDVPRDARLAENVPNWQGGLFQRCGEISYDYFGRAIRNGDFAIYHHGTAEPNLVSAALSRSPSGELDVELSHGS
jgi:hypothetical protein